MASTGDPTIFYGYFEGDVLETKPHFIFLIALYVLSAKCLEHICEHFNIVASRRFILLLVAITFSTLIFYIPQNIYRFIAVYPATYLGLIEPIMLLKMMYNLDTHFFAKFLPQVLLLSTAGILLFSCCFGYAMHYITQQVFPIMHVINYGLVMSSFDDLELSEAAKDLDALRYVVIILESESILSITMVDLTLFVYDGIAEGYVNTWYRIVSVFMRGFFGGLGVGYLASKLVPILSQIVKANIPNIVLTYVVLVYVTYFLSEYVLYVSGSCATMVVCYYIACERSRFRMKLDQQLRVSFTILHTTIENLVYLPVIYMTTIYALKYFAFGKFFQYLAVFFSAFITRMLVLLVFSPILYTIKYVRLKSIVAMLWISKKGTVQFLQLFLLFYNRETHPTIAATMPHTLAIIIFNIVMNGFFARTLLNLFGFSVVFKSKKENMDNCVRFIESKKAQFISMSKMFRLLADTNWFAIEKCTSLDVQYSVNDADSNYENYMRKLQTCFCDECERDKKVDLSKKEFQELLRECRVRLLNAKKVAFVRQHERGFLSREGLRMLLHAIESALNSKELELKVDDLLTSWSKPNFLVHFKDFLATIKIPKTRLRKPRQRHRRICYYIVTNRLYDEVFINLVILATCFVYYMRLVRNVPQMVMWSTILNFIVFFVDFWLRILGGAHIYLYDGWRMYFRNYWHRLEFILLILGAFDVCVTIHHFKLTHDLQELNIEMLYLYVLQMKNLRILRLLLILHNLHKPMLLLLNRKVGKRLAFGYDVAQCLLMAYNEVLHMLPDIIEYKSILRKLEEELMKGKITVLQQVCIVQHDLHWVSVTAKTSRILRATINTMKDNVRLLKFSEYFMNAKAGGLLQVLEQHGVPKKWYGWHRGDVFKNIFSTNFKLKANLRTMRDNGVLPEEIPCFRNRSLRLLYIGNADDHECEILDDAVGRLIRPLRKMEQLDIFKPDDLFYEVGYLSAMDKDAEYLFKYSKIVSWRTGETIVDYGQIPNAVYMIIEGVVMLSYNIDSRTLRELMNYGALPIKDYLGDLYFHKSNAQCLIPGNTMGELSMLTQRPYSCQLKTRSPTRAFCIPAKAINEVLESSTDVVNGFYSRVWKHLSVNVAAKILWEASIHKHRTMEDIYNNVEKAFVPNLSTRSFFQVSDMIEDIILIEGIVIDVNSGTQYVAPIYIPRSAHKLFLVKNLPSHVVPKLFIIPLKPGYQYQIVGEEIPDSHYCAKHKRQYISTSSHESFLQELRGRVSSFQVVKQPS